MGKHGRLRFGSESNLSDSIASRQGVLHDPAEMFVLDFSARHVATTPSSDI
jgi:hypothetical protein